MSFETIETILNIGAATTILGCSWTKMKGAVTNSGRGGWGGAPPTPFHQHQTPLSDMKRAMGRLIQFEMKPLQMRILISLYPNIALYMRTWYFCGKDLICGRYKC